MEIIENVKERGVLLPLSILRIIIGFMLVWGFIDKLFGLGMETPPGQGMIDGGSPTHQFLVYNDGWFSGFFNWMAGYSDIADILLMAGLLFIGVGLMLGIATKLSVLFGSMIMIMFFLAVFPISDNPLVDYHIVYVFVLIAIWVSNAGSYLGLGEKWNELSIVKRFPILE
ncbi:hypothetical protein LJB91_03595 [Bacteroidales bacterium OttesenSCG-928-L03]|nr:hypothetical protein [Bacteroidales bacterium OttesenSCG-928-L03]